MWHLALPFDEYFRKFWYPHLQWFQRSTDNCGKNTCSDNSGTPYMWLGMVFGIMSRTKARSATNEVPKCRSPERALHRHYIIGVRLLTSARRAKLPK